MKDKLTELEERETLYDNKELIKKYIEQIKYNYNLNQAINSLNTKFITDKQKELMEKAVTETLKTELYNELGELGISYINIHLKEYGSVGRTQYQLLLNKDEAIDLSIVLSEGEQRLLSIASFLAELKTSSHKNGIIFDDPVCSLCAEWREKVAKRLVKEGKNRQVIIFTHDIAFLYYLKKEAGIDNQNVIITFRDVERMGDRIGIVENELPIHVKSAEKRIGWLHNRCQEARVLYNNNKTFEYNEKCKNIYSHLRESWEKAIEDVVFNRSIQRFDREIHTKQLQFVEFNREVYKKIEEGMSNSSKYCHAQPDEDSISFPEPDIVKNDIEELDNFISYIKGLRESLKKSENIKINN